MEHGPNPVLEVREHLRRAAALLGEQHYAAALAEVDAALAIDSGSLAAQVLRQRIERAQAPSGGATSVVPEMDHPVLAKDLVVPTSSSMPAVSEASRRVRKGASEEARRPVASEGRFVPPGVDAQRWFGFEGRIQERRFRSLLEMADAAIRAADGIGARIALEEARELKPHARELDVLEARMAALPPVLPTSPGGRYLPSRAVGAVGLLLAGIALLIGVDYMRDANVAPSVRAVPDRPALPRDANEIAVPTAEPSDPADQLTPPRREVIPAPIAAAPAPAPVASPAAAVQEVAESRVERAASDSDRTVEPDAIRPADRTGEADTVRTAALVEPDRSTTGAREPLVAEMPRPPPSGVPAASMTTGTAVRRPLPAPTPTASASDSANASVPAESAVAPSPGRTMALDTLPASPLDEPSGLAEAAIPVLAEAAILAPVDERLVAQVLNQYARAYGQLDARAAREVYPTIDERALARAFAGLESQEVSFDSCDIDVRGTRADASCRGQASYVGRVGSREARTEPRLWRFELRRDGEAWHIYTAEARRIGYGD